MSWPDMAMTSQLNALSLTSGGTPPCAASASAR
jgi:hypothetical protein